MSRRPQRRARSRRLGIRSFPWLIALSLLPAPALAQPKGPDALADLSLEELLSINVTSTTLITQPIETAPSIISVLKEEQLRALGIRDLAEALQLVAGATVLRTKLGRPQLSIRTNPNDANVLVAFDGQRLNDFYDGYVPLDLPLTAVERIEVIRGPGSALYGTDAFSGVVSLFSHRRVESARARVETSLLIDDGVSYSTGVEGQDGADLGKDWNVSGSVAFRSTSGASVTVLHDSSEGLDYGKAPGEASDARRSFFGRLAVARTDLLGHDQLRVAALVHHLQHGPYFGPNRAFAPDSELQRSIFTSSIEYQYGDPDSNLELTVSAGHSIYHRDDVVQEQPDGYSLDLDGDGRISRDERFPEGKLRFVDHTSHRTSARAAVTAHRRRLPWGLKAHLLAGAEAEYNQLPGFSYAQNFEGDLHRPGAPRNWDELPLEQLDKTRMVLALFVQNQLNIAEDFGLTLGARYDHYSDFGQSFNPRAAFVWQARQNLTLKLMYASAFRAPTFRELYDHTSRADFWSGLVRGNTDLEPETTNTFDMGIDASLFERVNLRANLFYILNDDNIEQDATFDLGGPQYINYPGRRLYGSEIDAKLVIHPETYVWANFSWTHAEQRGEGLPGWERDNLRKFIDTELTEIPQLRANAAAVWRVWPSVLLGLRYSFIGKSENNRRLPSETVLRGFERSAFHQVSANGIVDLWSGYAALTLGITRSFGEQIPIFLNPTTSYQLPVPSFHLDVGLEIHTPVEK